MPPALGAQSLNHWTTREVSMNHFKVYNSVVFSTFAMLGNHPPYLVPEIFFTPERNSDLIKLLLPIYLFFQPLETTALLSPSRDSADSGHFIETEFYSTWSLCLASFVQRRVFSVPSGLDRAQKFLFMPGYSFIGWVDHILCLCSSADGRLSYFYLLTMVREAATSVCVGIFARVPVFSSFGYTPASGLTGSWVIPYVTAGRSLITSWHSFVGLSLSKSLPEEGLCKEYPLRPCMGASPITACPRCSSPHHLLQESDALPRVAGTQNSALDPALLHLTETDGKSNRRVGFVKSPAHPRRDCFTTGQSCPLWWVRKRGSGRSISREGLGGKGVIGCPIFPLPFMSLFQHE